MYLLKHLPGLSLFSLSTDIIFKAIDVKFDTFLFLLHMSYENETQYQQAW